MEFRLVYRGVLPSESRGDSRVKTKHEIRKAFHKQFSELYKHNSQLRFLSDRRLKENDGLHKSLLDILPENYRRCGYRFFPLINEKFGVGCDLDILFLRRDGPGSVVISGGDIDNRLKVLFDALRMPSRCEELPKTEPGEGENPFYCLLEDDKLITRVNIMTDRLLIPPESGERIHDVLLIISVKTPVVDATKAMIEFYT